jgi:hypothetical protein
MNRAPSLRLPARVTRLGPFSRDDALGASPRFAEGLILGAMVGAAIAGSTLWARFRRHRETTRSSRGQLSGG